MTRIPTTTVGKREGLSKRAITVCLLLSLGKVNTVRRTKHWQKDAFRLLVSNRTSILKSTFVSSNTLPILLSLEIYRL